MSTCNICFEGEIRKKVSYLELCSFCLICFLILQPEWKLADPICTFLFSVFVVITTLTIMRDILVVLMEGTYENHYMGWLSCQIKTIMILSLSEISQSWYYNYQGSDITIRHNTITIFKSYSIVICFIDFINWTTCKDTQHYYPLKY